MASGRPTSARGRLTRESKEAPLVHGCSQPPPDASIGAGPGHFRHFVSSVSAKHQLKDPLRQGGEDLHESEFYSMAPKTPGREGPGMRTLDISKVNKERCNWQRIDTFQTPYGNGQAVYEGATSSQRTRTASRERMGAQTQALAGLGLEIEQLRTDLKLAMADSREELSQTIAMAVNQIISELRQDVRAETAAVRQQLHMYEEARVRSQSLPVPSEPVAVSVAPSHKAHEEAEPKSAKDQQEWRALRESVEASNQLLADLTRRPQSSEELHMLNARVQALLELTREQVSSRLEQIDQSQAMQMDQVHARLDQLHLTQAALLEKMDLSTVRQISDLQASSRVLEEAVRAVAEAQRDASARPAEVPIQQAAVFAEVLQQIEDMQKFNQESFNHLNESINAKRDPQQLFAELRSSLEDLKVRLSDQGLDQNSLLKEIKIQLAQLHGTPPVDLSPVLSALHALQAREQKVDLSPILSALAGLHEDQMSLRESVRQNQTDLSPVLASLEQVRKGLASMSQEVEISREVVVKRADVSALSQTMQNAWELMTQTKAALYKVDFGSLLADVQRVLEEVRETRAELPKMARSLEVDFSPILRALQDRKRIDEEFGEKLVEEMHRLRRDCDLTQLTQSFEQVEPGLRALRQSVRENKISPEDFAPLMEEVQRLQSGFSGEFRQWRLQLCQLQEELAAVKSVASREPRLDFSPVFEALKEIRQEPLFERFAQVLHELKDLKSSMRESPQLQEHGELGQVVQDLQLVTSNLVETVRQEVMKVDLSPLMSEIQAIRGKVEVSSALKRQNEHMTKSDFATALEELRGHFSLLLSSFREVCDHSSGVSATAVNTLLQNLLEQRQRENESAAEDLDFLRQKLRDTQSVIGQAGSRVGPAELRGRVPTSPRPPERPTREIQSPSRAEAAASVAEPVTRIEPVTEPVAHLSSLRRP